MTLRIDPTSSPQTPPPAGESPVERVRSLIASAPLFIAVVVVPVVVSAIYFLLLASPIYISEARFIVRAPNEPQPAALSSVLQTTGLAQGATDAYAVHDYMLSRDAMTELARRHDLRAALGRPGSDFIKRFPRPFEKASNEHLFRAYKRFVSVGYDATTGVSTLRVEAFDPNDARRLAGALLDGGEQVINQLNDQAEQDAITRARQEVIGARLRVTEVQREMAGFRSRERLIDPLRSSNANLDLVSRLGGELASLRAERAGLAAAAPQSPQLPALDDRIRAYEREIENERSKAAGESNSLAPKISQYERLVLERDFAGETLTASLKSLETARLDAARKRLYLQRVVNPSLPDTAMAPHRWRSLLIVLLTSLLAYGALVLIRAGLREHQQ
jgi:capsular polysaccharide transport system permease protein